MKNLIPAFFALFLIISCGQEEPQTQEAQTADVAEAPQVAIDENTVYSFDVNTLKEGCAVESQMLCAVNMSIKCTIDPSFAECEANKAHMPSFIFMQDESLKRPTSQSYKVSSLKPLADGTIEVHTQSTCNGNWFGLCNGNIIYVMQQTDGKWIVKDLYALEN